MSPISFLNAYVENFSRVLNNLLQDKRLCHNGIENFLIGYEYVNFHINGTGLIYSYHLF